MDRVLQHFEEPIVANDGERYTAYLYGQSRPGDTWQGRLVFERQSAARDVINALPYGSADVVRAIDDLEKSQRRVVRRTEEGNDWLFLRE